MTIDTTTEPVPAWVNRARLTGIVVLAVVAAIGAAASYLGLKAGFDPWFPAPIAAALPFLVDGGILGASLRWLAGVRLGRPVHAWRLLAHAGVAVTIGLNAAASPGPGGIIWHVVAPASWAVLVELVARDAVGDHRAELTTPLARIPLRLWVTSPVESARTWVHVARTTAAVDARREVAVHGAARTMLRLATPTLRGWRIRRELVRRMRSGVLAPQAVLDACAPRADGTRPGREDILRAAVTTILTDPGPGHDRHTSGPQSPDRGPAQNHPDETPGSIASPAADRDRSGPAPLQLARPTGPDHTPGSVHGGPLRVVARSAADRAEHHWTGPVVHPARPKGMRPSGPPVQRSSAVRATGAARRSSGPAHEDPLWPTALDLARDMDRAGKPVTKRSMAAALRATSGSCGGDRAARLAAAARDAITADTERTERTADA